MRKLILVWAFILGCALALRVSPTPAQSTCLTTTDSLLNTGAGTATATLNLPFSSNGSVTVCKPGTVNFSGGYCFNVSDQMWQIPTDCFALTSTGTGSITVAYGSNGTANGTATMSVSATGVTKCPGACGYPNITYGVPLGFNSLAQPPQFPFQLSSTSNFNIDVSYALTGTITGENHDILYDQWIGYPGQNQAVEVAIFSFQDFINPINTNGTGSCTGYIGTFTQTITINGTPTPEAFLEYDTYIPSTPPCGSASAPYGGGYGPYGQTVWFLWPGTAPNVSAGYSTAEIAYDVMPFEMEALHREQVDFGASTINAVGPWAAAGSQVGSEFGQTTAPNFSLSISKMKIQTCTAELVAPPKAGVLLSEKQ